MQRIVAALWVSMSIGCGTNQNISEEVLQSFAHQCFGENEERDESSSEEIAVSNTAPFLTQRILTDKNSRARTYPRNHHDSLSNVSFATDGNGSLSNEMISMVVDTESAFSSDLKFNYEISDPRFDETALFVHAHAALEWFQDQGAKIPDEQLEIRATDDVRENNAVFLPADDRFGARIQVARGDGRILANLRTDRDVMMHEMSHHMIYRKVRSTSGDALIIHEGLADFFTAAMNDDPCIGASICAEGSEACAVQNACLRHLDNEVVFDDIDLAPHLRSQAVSGFLWDLREETDLTLADITKLVIHTIEQLGDNPSVHNLTQAMVQADNELFAGRHVSVMQTGLLQRHMD